MNKWSGIHNMLKYKHNTFNRKIKVYTKAFYKNKWYVKSNKLLDENGDSISSEKHFSQMRFSKGVIGFEYLPVSIFNLWLLILNLVKDFL
jgi:hypothetical protein